MKDMITTKKGKFDVGEYLGETLRKADEFTKCAIMLIDSLKTLKQSFVLDASGYLASHSAELYLKALIVGNAGQEGYSEFHNLKYKHNLVKLLDILIYYDKHAEILRSYIASLDKYSGDKVRFVENQITDHRIMDFSSSEIYGIKEIQKYAKQKFTLT